jgi:hypothetical protein
MELRRRRRTYREILHILRERCGLQISLAALHKYIGRRRKTGSAGHVAGAGQPMPWKMNATEEPPRGKPDKPAPASTPDEVRERIAALRRRRPEPESIKQVFEYNPDQPLHLVMKE